MDQKEIVTMEALIRGPLIRTNKPENVISVQDCFDAIDLHVIPPLVQAYREMLDIADSMENAAVMEQTCVHLTNMRNSIFILCQIGKEATGHE